MMKGDRMTESSGPSCSTPVSISYSSSNKTIYEFIIGNKKLGSEELVAKYKELFGHSNQTDSETSTIYDKLMSLKKKVTYKLRGKNFCQNLLKSLSQRHNICLMYFKIRK